MSVLLQLEENLYTSFAEGVRMTWDWTLGLAALGLPPAIATA